MAENLESRIQDSEAKFNKNFLEFILAQNKGLQAPIFENDEKAQEQLAIADAAYQRWYKLIQQDPTTTVACVRFFTTCKDASNLLLARDVQFFNCDGLDIFSIAFDAPGYDFMYRYSMFDHTSKGIFWNILVDMYRLSILISIYNNIPEVRKILNIILKNNQGITATNLMSTVKDCLKGNKEFQKLFKKLMKQGEKKVAFIFESIQYVLSAIQTNVADPWDEWIKQTNLPIVVDDHKTRIRIYQSFTSQEANECITRKWLTVEEVSALKKVWDASPELQETIRKFLWCENSHEIARVVECMKDGDDASIQKVMQESSLFAGHVDNDIQDLMNEWSNEFEQGQ